MTPLLIDQKHRNYDKWKKDWNTIADAKDGERAIKEKGTAYVPMLGGQNQTEYASYINRGVFYGALSRTISGLTGAMIRKEPIAEMPSKLDELMLESATLDGRTLNQVIEAACDEVLSYGRFGILVDINSDQLPYFSLYNTRDILNWKMDYVNGTKQLVYVVLHEIKDSDNVTLGSKEVNLIRHIYLDENGYLVNELYEEEDFSGTTTQYSMVETIEPTAKGKRLNYIPFVCIGSINNIVDDVNKPPLLDLLNLNMAHWRTTVDYYHGLHFCALPTVYALGFEKDDKEFRVGPGNVIRNRNPDAKVGMLEFSGQGLGAVQIALDSLEKQMAVMGSRLLESQKKATEAYETVRLRSSGDTAVLSLISSNVENGIEKALTYALDWLLMQGEINVMINKDFNPAQLDSNMITALVKAVQAGLISQNTFLYQMQIGEILPEDVSIEDEKDMIESEESPEFGVNALTQQNFMVPNTNMGEPVNNENNLGNTNQQG